MMVSPNEVAKTAHQKEIKNLKFRVYLKNYADSDKLDEQFLRLHNELFANYDCSKCRNCCKLFHTEIPTEDIDKDAAYLSMSADEFIGTYLKKDKLGLGYMTKNKPCDFLQADGECMLGNNKPEACKNYPHTNQPDRMLNLLSFLDNVGVCPVAYEICERLKLEYNFR